MAMQPTTPPAPRAPLLEEEGMPEVFSPPFKGGVAAKQPGWFNQ